MPPRFLTKQERQQLKQVEKVEEKPKLKFEKPKLTMEMEMLKKSYMEGIKRPKIRNYDRRFQFKWNESDDTSVETNPLYSCRVQPKQSKTMEFDQHWTEKPLDKMTERDWRILREDFDICTTGGNIPHPLRTWDLPKPIMDIVLKLGYKNPTPIQRQSIPILLQLRDLIGVAETGSGKTASFLIPMLIFLQSKPKLDPKEGPYCLVMAPTRELAQQIHQEVQKFNLFRSILLVGGHSLQGFALNYGEIVIATPGRLKDCLDRSILVLNQCTFVVLDEADRMIDLGFEQDVTWILDQLPKLRQTTMFSATMPPAVEKLARRYLKKPATVSIGKIGKAVDRIKQIVEFMDESNKRKRLFELLESYSPPIIVFFNHKKTVDSLSKIVQKQGFNPIPLHGGKSQEQRESAISKIKNKEADVLLATDVAGRGLDLQDVSLVINFDMAKSIEDYIHRIGRTGRAGKSGTAVTFLTSHDSEVMYDLKTLLIKSGCSCPPELANHEAAQVKPGFVPTKRKFEETLYSLP